MTELDLSMIKDNNPYKVKCEAVEENLNTEHFLESTVTMAITLEKLTKYLIRREKINISDVESLTQDQRISILKINRVITYNLSEDFYIAKKIRNDIIHGYKPGNYYYTSLMKNHFLKIMVWYDENYVPEKINPVTELKQYLNKVCDDSSIINIIEQEINDIKITEKSQITKRIKEELINYVKSLNIELEIKEKIIKGISSGIIKNKSQIEEKTKGQRKDPRIGVANIINTENMMKYTIQSTDIDKELKENMEKLENNTHKNKQLQEDYNKYGLQSFTTETITICKNKAQSQMVKEDEIIFNANKSYNNGERNMKPKIGVANIVNTENMMKYTIQSTDIDKELKENMEKLENNTHKNKQLQEDYNKYGLQSFTTETVTICKTKAQSELVKKDEIIFNANKSYNYNRKKEKRSEDTCNPNIVDAKNNKEYPIQSTDIDKELKENMENEEEEIEININKSDNSNNQPNRISRIRKFFKK